jgi:hypothetical protein
VARHIEDRNKFISIHDLLAVHLSYLFIYKLKQSKRVIILVYDHFFDVGLVFFLALLY